MLISALEFIIVVGIVGQNVQSHHWLYWDTDLVNLQKKWFLM